jgi:outer membrane protein
MNKRKIFTLTALLLFLCSGVVAQIEKGKILASGSLGLTFRNYKSVYDGNSSDETKNTNFSLTPRAGYFITDAIAVGAGLNFSTSSTKFDDDDKNASTEFSFTPFVRYYLPQGLFGQFEIGLGSSKDKWTYANDDVEEYKYKTFIWSLGAGYPYFLNDNVAIEPMVSYYATTYTDRDDTNYKDKYGYLMVQIGFSIYLDFK